MNRFRKNEKGFTLVELLIVVAIIGILAAIAIPQFTKYKKNASKSACESDMKNCMSETAAQYSLNSSINNQTCDTSVIGNKFPGMIFTDANGTLFLAAKGTTAVPTASAQVPVPKTVYGTNMNGNLTQNGALCILLE